jgi:hypothetical protein
MKVARGSAANEVVQVIDNSKGWATVDNIPVPPVAEHRSFKKPLGLGPALINGGIIPTKAVFNPELKETPRVEQLKAGLGGDFPQGLSSTSQIQQMHTPVKSVSVEVDWYGAKLSLNCLNAVYQSAIEGRGNQGWIMLEMTLDEKTGNPPWIPPIAELQKDGRIFVPELKCKINGKVLRCQILNIELFDKINSKYIVVFRVVE